MHVPPRQRQGREVPNQQSKAGEATTANVMELLGDSPFVSQLCHQFDARLLINHARFSSD